MIDVDSVKAWKFFQRKQGCSARFSYSDYHSQMPMRGCRELRYYLLRNHFPYAHAVGFRAIRRTLPHFLRIKIVSIAPMV